MAAMERMRTFVVVLALVELVVLEGVGMVAVGVGLLEED